MAASFKRRVLFASILLIGTLLPGIAHAQSAKTIFAQVSGQISDLNGNGVPKATIRLDGPTHLQTSGDANGHFIFVNVAPGDYTLSANAPGYDSLTRNDIDVSTEDLSLAISLSVKSALKEIGHVATTTGRSALNVTAAPSYDITPADMQFQGVNTWRTILSEIPGVDTASYYGGTLQTVPSAPSADTVVSIRGSLPYETSMMIDNMPMFDSSYSLSGGGGVDLAQYDPHSFNAFDVVSGPGAESPSILDAIGGSLNLHPAEQVTQNSYNFAFGDDPYGGYNGSASAAMRFGDKLSATVTYSLNNSPGPITTPIQLGAVSTHIYEINGEPYSCPGCSTGTVFPNGANARSFMAQQNPILGCCFPATDLVGWSQHAESMSLFYHVSPTVGAHFFFADNSDISQSIDSYEGIQFVLPATSVASYTGMYPNGVTIDQPQASPNADTVYSSSEVFEGKLTFQLGRGQLWVAALSNESRDAIGISIPTEPFSLQLYGGGYLCATPPCTGTTGANPFTPVTFNGGTYRVNLLPLAESPIACAHNRDITANYAVPFGNNGRGSLSYVHSYADYPQVLQVVTNSVNGTTGALVTTAVNSITVTPGAFQTTDQFRLGLGFTPSEKTTLDFSYYFVDARFHVPVVTATNTFGDLLSHDASPRVSFTWRQSADTSVRASMGGGYAIAPLFDMIGTSGVLPSCNASGYCTSSVPNLNLQPEKSWGYDAGIDHRIGRNAILSFDAYLTNLQGQFYSSTECVGQYFNPAIGSNEPLYLTQYRNLGESRFEGLELGAHQDVPHGLVWTLSASLQRAYLVSVPPGFYNAAGTTCNFTTGVGCANRLILANVNFGSGFNSTFVPYAQGFGLIGYRWSPDKFINITAHYFGNNNGYHYPAFMAFSASGQMPITKHVALQGTFNNITGIHDAPYADLQSGSIYSTAYLGPAYLSGNPYGPRIFLLSFNFHQ